MEMMIGWYKLFCFVVVAVSLCFVAAVTFAAFFPTLLRGLRRSILWGASQKSRVIHVPVVSIEAEVAKLRQDDPDVVIYARYIKNGGVYVGRVLRVSEDKLFIIEDVPGPVKVDVVEPRDVHKIEYRKEAS